MLRAMLVAFVTLLAGESAIAAQRTFVSGKGVDSNACSLVAPCRSFGAAMAFTDDGGEIIALDSAGYGPVVSLTQSFSINAAPGVYAGISVSAAADTGVYVGTATVKLSGLTIVSAGGSQGIALGGAGRLDVENCHISGFIVGVEQRAGVLNIRNSVISESTNNNQARAVDILAGKATLDGVSIDRAAFGIVVAGNGALTVRSSTLSDVFATGVVVSSFDNVTASLDGVAILRTNTAASVQQGNAGGVGQMHIVRGQIVGSGFCAICSGTTDGAAFIHVSESLISQNFLGASVSGNGRATVSGNTIVRNAVGLDGGNGSLYTMRDNQVRDNTNNIAGPLLPLTFD